MKHRFDEVVERGRWRSGPYASDPYDDFGAFEIDGPCGARLKIVASPGDANENIPWEHVSVSCKNRCPNWMEMNFVKDLFWHPHEAVVQFHPPKSDYVNMHEYCLHMWRPLHQALPLPPSIAVGFRAVEPKDHNAALGAVSEERESPCLQK